LSETADQIIGVWSAGGDAEADDAIGQLVERYTSRLVEGSNLEFKNAVRAYTPVVTAGQSDRADAMLLRAVAQAESVSELLAIAALRRRAQVSVTEADDAGVRCLTRALSLARDRLERIQIARELFRYGRIGDARAILNSEHIFDGATPLSPVEMVAALQCGAMQRDERDNLIARAVDDLNTAYRSGALGRYAPVYATRLIELFHNLEPTAEKRVHDALDPRLTAPLATEEWEGEERDQWSTIRRAVQDSILDRNQTLSDGFGSADPATSFGLRLATVALLQDMLDDALKSRIDAMPNVPDEEIPTAEADSRNPRAIELSDLWRARLTAVAPDDLQAAESRLRTFFETEEVLREQWERLRREAAEPYWRQIAQTASALAEFLPTVLGPRERAETHPILRGLYEQVAADIEDIARDVAEQASSAQATLAVGAASALSGADD
jgi:hypothetical protein